MKLRKRTLLAVLSVVLVLVIAAGGTSAYYAARTPSANNPLGFETGTVEIEETFDGWNTKEVKLKNTSTKIPGVVRALLIPRAVNANGNYTNANFGSITAPENNKIVMGDITLELADDWQSNWFFKDGFFYCKKVLAAGETSPILLKKVSLSNDSEELKARFRNLSIKIDVQADLIQAEGDGPETEWGVAVTGTSVTAI